MNGLHDTSEQLEEEQHPETSPLLTSSSSSSLYPAPSSDNHIIEQHQPHHDYILHSPHTSTTVGPSPTPLILTATEPPSLIRFDEAPPSYETISKDIPQLHDNYDHIRGPPAQRGKELKNRIPSESLSSSYFPSGHAAGAGSAAGPSVPRVYGSTYGVVHYPTSAQAPTLGLSGQIALSDENEGDFAQDMDRLLGPEDRADGASHEDDDDDDNETSCWSAVGDSQAWASLGFMLFVLIPWTFFCYAWTLVWAVCSLVVMIIPPLGYCFSIFSITSWRALARVDVVLSAALVSDEFQQKYPYRPAQVFIAPEPGPAWQHPRLFGRELPLPDFIRRKLVNRHSARGRRPKNLWHRASKHLMQTMDRHTWRSFFYFTFFKMLFAIISFLLIVPFFGVTVPFMICLLPSLLVVSKKFAEVQYRWAVCWLNEKPAPVIV